MNALVVPFLTYLCALGAQAVFEYKDCTPQGSPINLTRLDITPNPIVLPGNIRLTVEGSSNAPIDSSTLTLSMWRKSIFGEIHIPCLLNIGSCTYDDICTLLDQMEKENWAGIMGGVATQIKKMFNAQGVGSTQCPFPPQSIRLDNYDLHLPEVPSVLSSFAAGDYHFHITMVEKSSGITLLCLDGQMHLKQQSCSGFSCLFG